MTRGRKPLKERGMAKLIVAAVITVAYVAFAVAIIHTDRTTGTGHFISLNGLVSAVVTAPDSFPFDFLGHPLDYKNNVHMGIAILVSGILVFAVSYGAMSLAQSIWVSMR